MKTETLETLLRGKSIDQVMGIAQGVQDPMLQISSGLDFSNVTIQSTTGAIRFCVFESPEDAVTPGQFAVGYVTVINGPWSSLYEITESDLDRIRDEHGDVAATGLRNSRILSLQQ